VTAEPREQFLARVREALTNRGEAVELPTDLEVARVIGRDEDVVQVFAMRAEEAKMHVHRVADTSAMMDKILQLLEEMGAQSVIVPAEATLPTREQLIERIREKGVTLLDADDPDASFSADVGITGVTKAIAETASMCITSGDGRRRLASLAVPCHIGVVRAEQIVPDLLDWSALLPTDLPASEVLVSAPSKTSDIELTLVMGVHGPNPEHVILVG
jgi:L-lactate dehydrogenase complex protein LldG